ncbi:MAG: tail fiber domain-containing protein [Bacteroidaceae bacterium]|nr:tail fiber domain-containing protein [Bacteroidaceae bacterium]
MEKTLLSMLMIASCFSVANAQLMVDENGRVGVGIETNDTLLSEFTVNGRGQNEVAVCINTDDLAGLMINRTGRMTSSTHYGIYALSEPHGGTNFGVYGSSTNSTGTQTVWESCGVGGIANGSMCGANFGVAGLLSATSGAGIFGSTAQYLGGVSIEAAYAGYFIGNVNVTGTLYVPTILQPSDYRLKSDVKSVSGTCLDKVLDMNIVEFKYKQREFKSPLRSVEDSTRKCVSWYDEESAFMKNKHYGLIAQELQQLYPDLVVEGEDGYLGVNYIEIIPLLIRSIQELNAKIEQYEQGNATIRKAQSRTADATNLDAVVTTLYQNEPNPFSERTVIRVDVAEDVATADLYIYNMNGEQLTEYPITERGATSITIDGGSLNAGMYLYALIADGQVIDTKRMILTK